MKNNGLPTRLSRVINKFDTQLFRFILVGGLNTFCSCLFFLILTQLGLHYVYAITITWCVGILFSFKTTGKLVFKNNDKTLLIKFIILYCTVYLISIALLKVFNGLLNNISISGIITVIITSCLSFLGNKNLVFSQVSTIKERKKG